MCPEEIARLALLQGYFEKFRQAIIYQKVGKIKDNLKVRALQKLIIHKQLRK